MTILDRYIFRTAALAFVATLVTLTGAFAVFSYIAPLAMQGTGLSEFALPAVLLAFGVGAVAGNITGGTPFPNNTVPQSMWQPLSSNLLKIYQAIPGYASLPAAPNPGYSRYFYNNPDNLVKNQDMLRIDYAVNNRMNAFFRWEFNSCETLIRDGVVYPIDYANACPDVAITSLHYYFPWAMTALVRWSTYCVVTGRRGAVDLETARYFAIADGESLSYDEKVDRYLALADEHFETERYWEWSGKHLAHLPEAVLEWVTGDDFDRLLMQQEEQNRLIERAGREQQRRRVLLMERHRWRSRPPPVIELGLEIAELHREHIHDIERAADAHDERHT